jgi:hypothetical protein
VQQTTGFGASLLQATSDHNADFHSFFGLAFCPTADSWAHPRQTSRARSCADHCSKSPAQVALRWHINLGVGVIAQSNSTQRIATKGLDPIQGSGNRFLPES